MTRSWMFLLTCGAVPCYMMGQCGIGGGISPFVPVEIQASAIGQKGLGGSGFGMSASCPGEPNAHVKVKFDPTIGTRDAGLIISPSSGITPFVIQVGVDPKRVANSFPGSVTVSIGFTTVDQNPPATTQVAVRVSLTTPDLPVIQSIVNAASFAPMVTPGAVVLVRGMSLGPNISATLEQTGLYPTTLGNTTVAFNGILAPILSSGPTAIKAVVPYAIAGQQSAQVIVTHYPGSTAEQVSSPFSVPVAETSLGIFTRIQHSGFPIEIQNCDANGCSTNSAENPAPPGSIITLFATGVAPWAGPNVDGSVAILPQLYDLSKVSLTVSGQPSQILYAGVAPYQVWGMFQVNARIPEAAGSGPQPAVLTVGGANNALQEATVAVQ